MSVPAGYRQLTGKRLIGRVTCTFARPPPTRAARAALSQLPGVDGVLCGLEAQLDEQLGGVGGLLDEGAQFRALARGEVLQHERRPRLAPGRPSDAEPHSSTVG